MLTETLPTDVVKIALSNEQKRTQSVADLLADAAKEFANHTRDAGWIQHERVSKLLAAVLDERAAIWAKLYELDPTAAMTFQGVQK